MTRTWLAGLLAVAACQSSSPTRPVARAPVAKAPVASAPEAITQDELDAASIASVEIRGLRRLGRSDVRLAIRSHPGESIVPSKLRDDLRRVMAIPGVGDVRVDAVRVGDGIGLVFIVTEAPLIRAVEIEGNTAVSDRDVRAELTLAVGDVLDPLAARDGAAEIERKYRSSGYYRVKVTWSARRPSDGAVVTYSITEGPAVSIDRINISGVRAIAKKELVKLLESAGTNAVGGVYDEEALAVGLLRISAAYYDVGHVNVKVGQPSVKIQTADKIQIDINIEEGAQFRLGKLVVTGKLDAPAKAYVRLLESKTGSVFNRTKIGADIQRLTAFQQQKSGRATDFVTPITKVDLEKRIIDVSFEIDQ